MFFTVCVQAASLLLIASAVTSTNDTITINVPDGRSRNGLWDCSPIVMQSFYKKFQSVGLYLGTATAIYIKVPGLSFAFHHATPLVYRLTFESECRISEQGSVFQLEFMYDDNLLRNGRQLVPNNGQDLPSIPTHWHNPSAGAYHKICIHSEIVYLSSGTHLIDVGFRLLAPFPNTVLSVSFGTLRVELTQYQVNVDHGLPIITVNTPIG